MTADRGATCLPDRQRLDSPGACPGAAARPSRPRPPAGARPAGTAGTDAGAASRGGAGRPPAPGGLDLP
ncbi:hypothetical protein D9R14_04660 [Xanthobacter tagetidis]|uniref:Uncharacterized protein n=1 Tax=Xanthobacter tagetidis TaxID=60216 RepID=A0A3L7AIP7_9HYPH|nr:hypothetical protein D9R14_04660 [Xanthobacter tagetidis]